MEDWVLTLYDEQGNPIPIPAIQGVGIKEIRLKEEGETEDTYEIVLDDKRVFSFHIKHGDDYVLTEADKAEIAEEAAKLVDVPGGSEADFEPLEEITISEEGISEIIVDKGYRLAKILVNVVFPENCPLQTIKVNVLTENASIDIALKSVTTYKQYGVAYLERRNGRFFGDTALSIANETNNNVQHYRAASLLGTMSLSKNMKGVKIFPFNQTFVVGTKISVWGVR